MNENKTEVEVVTVEVVETTLGVKIDEFGVDKAAAQVAIGNLPELQAARDILTTEHNRILKMDISDPLTAKMAREVRIKIQKNRTQGFNLWHKTNKEVSLSYCKLLDAVKNREELVNKGMEEALLEIEKDTEIKEKKRVDELTISRTKELEIFELLIVPENLGTLEAGFFETLKAGYQAEFDNKALLAQQQIDKDIEARRVADLQISRAIELEAFEVGVIPDDLGSMSDSTWEMVLKGHKADFDTKEKERQIEADRIAEKQRLADEAEAENNRLAELEKNRRFRTSLLSAFIENYDDIEFAQLSEPEYTSIVNAAIEARKVEEERIKDLEIENKRLAQVAADKKIEDARLQKIEDDKTAALQKTADEAKEKADRLEKEATDKKIADEKAENDRLAQIETDKQAELDKGDKDKVLDLINDLKSIQNNYSFDSDENKKMYTGVNDLLTKVITFINK